MKIIVCVKQVPENDSVKIDPKTNDMVRTGAQGVMNPFDRNAIETALELKEKNGGQVILLIMGPDSFTEVLRDGLAMGADSAYLLSSKEFGGADTLATAYTLVAGIKKIGKPDVILFGRQSEDADTGQVGPIVAEDLNIPQATFATKVETISATTLEVDRDLESSIQKVEIKLPAEITVRSEINFPRYETPINIVKSFDKPLTIWNEKDLNVDPDKIGKKGSQTIVTKVYAPKKETKQVKFLSKKAGDAAKTIINELDL